MIQPTFTATDAPALAVGARCYRLTCPHGVSSAAVLPGRGRVADLVVLDVLLARHHRSWRCACLPTPVGPLPDATARA